MVVVVVVVVKLVMVRGSGSGSGSGSSSNSNSSSSNRSNSSFRNDHRKRELTILVPGHENVRLGCVWVASGLRLGKALSRAQRLEKQVVGICSKQIVGYQGCWAVVSDAFGRAGGGHGNRGKLGVI